MWLAVPELEDWARISGFKYRNRAAAQDLPDLHLRDFLANLPDPCLTNTDDLHKRYAYAISTERS
jgi:hypothetical protein